MIGALGSLTHCLSRWCRCRWRSRCSAVSSSLNARHSGNVSSRRAKWNPQWLRRTRTAPRSGRRPPQGRLKESQSRISNLTFLNCAASLTKPLTLALTFTFTRKTESYCPLISTMREHSTYIYSETLSLVTSFRRRILQHKPELFPKLCILTSFHSRRTFSWPSSAVLLLNIPRLPQGAGYGRGQMHQRLWLRAIPHHK